MPLNPVVGHSLRLCDLGSGHVPGDSFDVCINGRVERGSEDGEPHVLLLVVLW